MIPVVLYAEDDPALSRVVEEWLSDAGFHVLSVPNGSEALRLLRDGARVDLLLTDIEMPVLDGRGLIEAMKTNHPEYSAIPLVVLAADAGSGGLPPGAAFLSKPANRTRLLSVIRENLLGRFNNSPPRIPPSAPRRVDGGS